MTRKKGDADGFGTRLKPKPCTTPTVNSNVVQISGTSAAPSDNAILLSGIVNVNVSPVSPHHSARTVITTKRATKQQDQNSKIPRDLDEGSASNNRDVVSPGAFSVLGSSNITTLASRPSTNNYESLETSSVFVHPGLVDNHRAPSLVIAAQLITQDYSGDEDSQDEDLEHRIEQEVESRLTRRDPTLVVAEAMPSFKNPNSTSGSSPIAKQTTWNQFYSKWKFPLMVLLLCVCGAIVGAIVFASQKGGDPTQEPASDQRSQARIKEILRSHPNLTIDEDLSTVSPQSLALEWLLLRDTNRQIRNGHASDDFILERYGLAVLFYSTNGVYWQNQFGFLTESDVCDWNNESYVSYSTPALPNGLQSVPEMYGVYCDKEKARVQHVVLSENDLIGTLPSELSLLSKLQTLVLQSNELVGVIPTELGRITALQELGLAHNMIGGPLPTESGRLTTLRILDVSSNNVTIPLPTELGLMTSLMEFHASSNSLTGGTLPTELGRLTRLQILNVALNQMVGPLPSEVGLMTSLLQFDISWNSFTGTLPTEFGRLTLLEQFFVISNTMMGTIPTELGLMTSLKSIELSSNSFTGTLPTELGRLIKLQSLYTFENTLTGWLPSELGFMTTLTHLGLSSNSFTGTLPTEVGRLTILQHLSVSSNKMTGSLPTELGIMTALTGIATMSNSFTGTLPTEVGQLSLLLTLYMFTNNMTGPLPTELGLLTSLIEIDVSFNFFTGTLPTELGQLTALATLNVPSNHLTGTLPTELGLMRSLFQIVAYSNSLTGTLPTELGQLTAFAYLDISQNDLNGTIPVALTNNSNVQVVFEPQRNLD